jgi:hypothetical protein
MTNEEPQPHQPEAQPRDDDAVSRVAADVRVPANATVAANVISGGSAKAPPVPTADPDPEE